MKIYGRGGLLKYFASDRRAHRKFYASGRGGHFEIFASANEYLPPLDVNSVTSLKGTYNYTLKQNFTYEFMYVWIPIERLV